MLPPCYYLSRDINMTVLNMRPRTWMCLTLLQQPGCHHLLAVVYPFFTFFLKVLISLENMVNVKCSNFKYIEAWTSVFVVQSASRKTARIPCLDLDCLPRVFIRDTSSKLFVFIISYIVGFRRLGYFLWCSNGQIIKVILIIY